jgi:hypothetical protein
MRLLKNLVVTVAFSSAAWGQSLMPRAEFSVGYTYASLDQNIGFGSTGRLNGHGINTGVSVSINRLFGVEANYAGVFNGQISALAGAGVTSATVATETHHTFVAGPRVNFGTGGVGAFVHGLFGVDHQTITAASGVISPLFTGASAAALTDSAFATALGGGLEFGARKRVGMVMGADYLLTRHGLPSILSQVIGVSGKATQNNFRVSVGVVFHFGSLSKV